jgi:hypothetical protein
MARCPRTRRSSCAAPVPRSSAHLRTGRDLHRSRVGQHGLGPVPVAGIPAITPFRVVLAVAEVVIELPFQGTLDHHFRQLAQQPALAGQPQPASAGPLGKLAQQLLISRRQLRRLPVPAGRLTGCHVCHWCLLRLWSYTVEITVPGGYVALQAGGLRLPCSEPATTRALRPPLRSCGAGGGGRGGGVAGGGPAAPCGPGDDQ